jgi:hypothetical protein
MMNVEDGPESIDDDGVMVWSGRKIGSGSRSGRNLENNILETTWK